MYVAHSKKNLCMLPDGDWCRTFIMCFEQLSSALFSPLILMYSSLFGLEVLPKYFNMWEIISFRACLSFCATALILHIQHLMCHDFFSNFFQCTFVLVTWPLVNSNCWKNVLHTCFGRSKGDHVLLVLIKHLNVHILGRRAAETEEQWTPFLILYDSLPLSPKCTYNLESALVMPLLWVWAVFLAKDFADILK